MLTLNGASPQIILNGSAAPRIIYGQNAGKNRWGLNLGNGAAESTGNVGTNFWIGRYDDAGTTLLDTPIAIDRGTGVVTQNQTTFVGNIQTNNNVTASGAVVVNNANAQVIVNNTSAAGAGTAYLIFQHGGLGRWNWMSYGPASPADGLYLQSCNDAGTVQANVLYIDRNTSAMSLTGSLSVSGNASCAQLTCNGLTTQNWGGQPTTGLIFFGNSGAQYLYWNGSKLTWNNTWNIWSDQICPASLAQSGYQKFSNGMIMQWGVTGSGGGNANFVVTLPTSFPNAFWAFIGMAGGDTGPNMVSVTATPPNNGQIVIYPRYVLSTGGVGNATQGVYWVAFGY